MTSGASRHRGRHEIIHRERSLGVALVPAAGTRKPLGTVADMTDLRTDRPSLQVSSRRPLYIVAAVIVALVAVRTVISMRGYLLGDDFAVRYRAAVTDWSFDYAFEPYNDHISPIGYSLQWVLQWAFPGSHIALVLATSVFMLATLVGIAGALWVLTARWLSVVLGSVTVGLGLFTFEVATWWTTSLYSVTYLAFVAAALWALTAAVRWGSPTWLVLVGLIGAALSDSKGFLALVLVFGLAAGIDMTGTGRLGVLGAWRKMRWVWSSAAIVGAALVALSAFTTTGVQGELTVSRAVGMLRDLWVLNIAPAVLGGPWWWSTVPMQEWAPVRVLPAPPLAIGWVCLVLCALGVAYVVRRRPPVAGFVPYVLLYALATTAIPVVGRAGTNLSSAAYRYTYDIVLPVAILIALAVVPLWWEQARPGRWGWGVVAGLTASMVVSTVAPAQHWAANESKAYVQRAVAGFGSVPTGQVVIPQGVPEDLVPGLLWPWANTDAVLSPQPGAPQFGEMARGELWGFAADGSVETQEVLGPQSLPGPDPNCGYAVTEVPRTIPLDSGLIAWTFMARVAYFSGVDTTLYLAVGGEIHTVALPASDLTAVYFPVQGPGSDVLVSIGTPGATACVTDVRIGNRVHPDGDQLVPLVPKGLPQ